MLRVHRLPVKRFVGAGALPHRNPLFVQIGAGALGEDILTHPFQQGPALGARDPWAAAACKGPGGSRLIRPAPRLIEGVGKGLTGRGGTLVASARPCTKLLRAALSALPEDGVIHATARRCVSKGDPPRIAIRLLMSYIKKARLST